MPATRVVIADDESIIRMDLREMLTSMGYQVVGEASDGQTAINLARQTRPDLVIMDIRMPDLDGIEAARILTREKIAPVLLLTAYSQQELVDGAKEAGVVGYLVKPFREPDLKPAIEIALQRYREFRALEKEVSSLAEQLETRKLVDRAKGILMDRHGLKEAEAYSRMQKLSMNSRKSMREIAEAILLNDELQR
ncbi:MAG: Fis family transcriptional regulator [Dehalococcoidia bacterium]|nr:MAG: Fis family transcriptional regulator [Dehalococcoidia bacterium]